MIHFLYIRSAGESVDAPPKRNQPASPSQTANHSDQTVVDQDTSGERDMAEKAREVWNLDRTTTGKWVNQRTLVPVRDRRTYNMETPYQISPCQPANGI